MVFPCIQLATIINSGVACEQFQNHFFFLCAVQERPRHRQQSSLNAPGFVTVADLVCPR